MSISYFILQGIHALARQWKCIIIGAEGEEKIFQANRSINRKHVVGRGVLPDKDLAFLIQDSSVADKEKETEDDLAEDQTSVGQKQGISQPASPVLVLSSDTDSEKVALLEPSKLVFCAIFVYSKSWYVCVCWGGGGGGGGAKTL